MAPEPVHEFLHTFSLPGVAIIIFLIRWTRFCLMLAGLSQLVNHHRLMVSPPDDCKPLRNRQRLRHTRDGTTVGCVKDKLMG